MERWRGGEARQSSPPGLLRSIGPELVSAASDNDPTNVGTAAAVGARTGYQLSWVALLVAPLLGVVLTIAAQVGTVARDDLQSLALKRYGQGVAMVLLVSVVVVNLVTIAADLQAGAAGIGLLTGVDTRWLVVPLGSRSGRPAAGGPVRPRGCGAPVPDARLPRLRGGSRARASGLAAPARSQPAADAVTAARRASGWPRPARHHAH
jgi:hypothetical protein